MEIPLQEIDWSLLRSQKLDLVEFLNESFITSTDDGSVSLEFAGGYYTHRFRLESLFESIDGVIALIDWIQDMTVDEGHLTERQVFGMNNESND